MQNEINEQDGLPKPSYYAIIPANVRYCKELKPNAKLLYGEITALSNAKGYCYASNRYFAELYGIERIQTISDWVGQLQKLGFISVELTYKGKEIDQRIIKIIPNEKTLEVQLKNVVPTTENSCTPTTKKRCVNNTSSNNTSNKLSIPIIDKSIIEIQPSCDKSHLGWQKVKFNNIYDIKELCSKWLGTDAILQYEGMLSLDLESKSKSKNLSTEEYFAKIYNMSFQAEKSVLNTEGKAKRAASVFSSISANTELFQCYSTYVTFFEKETGGILKHSASDYSILQDIIAYLRKISTSKVFSAIKSFEAILNNLPKFFKSTANLKLFKLSQNLEAIVSQIKANANVPKALPTLSPADAKEQAIKTLAEIGLTDEMIALIQSPAKCADLQTAKNLTISQLFKAGKFDAANGDKFNQCLKVLRPMLR
jgi:predicted DNA-binding protein YlxM (UPF0122 family)